MLKSGTYAAEAEVEEHHWWFAGRRRLFSRIIRSLELDPAAPILDVGTSTGTNLRMLRELGFANVQGVDLSEEALRYCESKGFPGVRQGSICDLPYPGDQFDLVLATDVIEHVDHDLKALEEVRRVLRPGGTALVTVPAFTSLWGPQDVVAEHRRRYRMGQLQGRIDEARLETPLRFYFNYLLFVPIFVARKLLRLLRVPIRSENDLNFGLMNWALSKLFDFDTWSARYLKPPFGVSILAVCRKPAGDASRAARI